MEKFEVLKWVLTTTGVSVETTGFWCWLRTPIISMQSVEYDEIPTLPLVQQDSYYLANKIFLLVCDMWANSS